MGSHTTDATNTDTVMGMYAAFGRGDVEHILDRLSDDVRWDHGIRENPLPYLQPRTGKQEVAQFFTDLLQNVEFTTFEPGPPCAGDNRVMVAIRQIARNVRTGVTIPEQISVHIWDFGPDGKVESVRHVIDIASHERAAQPVGASASTA